MFGPDHPQYKVPQYVELSERITKTRKGLDYSVRDIPGRAYADHENPLQCPVRTLKLYEKKKDPAMNKQDAAYFLTCSQPAIRNPDCTDAWFTRGPMGVNYIGNLLTDSVRAAGYDPKKYKITANSTRKTLATAACAAGVPGAHISKKMGHKNLNSALGYLKVDEKSQRATGLALSRTLEGLPKSGFQEILGDGPNIVQGNTESSPSSSQTTVAQLAQTPQGNQKPMTMMTAPAPMFNPLMAAPMMAPMAPMVPQMMSPQHMMTITSQQMMGNMMMTPPPMMGPMNNQNMMMTPPPMMGPMVQMMNNHHMNNQHMMMGPPPMMSAAMNPTPMMSAATSQITPTTATMMAAAPTSSTVSTTAAGGSATTTNSCALADITNTKTKRESKNNYKGEFLCLLKCYNFHLIIMFLGAKSSKMSAESGLKVTFVRGDQNDYSLK